MSRAREFSVQEGDKPSVSLTLDFPVAGAEDSIEEIKNKIVETARRMTGRMDLSQLAIGEVQITFEPYDLVELRNLVEAHDAEVAIEEDAVKINSASFHELASLPGIGYAKAKAIVSHREAFGQFENASDLAEVSGMGPKAIHAACNQISFKPAPKTQKPAPCSNSETSQTQTELDLPT